ncbi:MAG: hypothetical protein ABW104_17985 [Candidatus Thiodiazotropha sp. 6PLUC2]
MSEKLKNFHVQLIGPSGLVYVGENPQAFTETGRNILEVERQIESRNMAVDPLKGTSVGHFKGCWMSISEMPDDGNTT